MMYIKNANNYTTCFPKNQERYFNKSKACRTQLPHNKPETPEAVFVAPHPTPPHPTSNKNCETKFPHK